MTPVEERIDHEEAIERLRFLTKHTEKFVGRECHGEVVVRCADVVALLALLTEHSALKDGFMALYEVADYSATPKEHRRINAAYDISED